MAGRRHVEIYRSPNKWRVLRRASITVKLMQQWRFRVRAANGEITGGGQAYTRKSSAVKAARREYPGVPVEFV